LHNDSENINILVEGCKKDDRKAQEQLYRNYYKAMMSLCLRYTKNEQDALEVLNTGFFKVFKNIQRYDSGQANLYTWIRTIVINSCLDFIKAKDRLMYSGELDTALEVHIEPAVIAKLRSDELLRLIRQIPPATQAVFNLYVLEGYSHKEIAAMLNISEGTGKWHLSEARKKLQKLINEQL
jgi:RNA polymerase sigma factor (sigma-70 family)